RWPRLRLILLIAGLLFFLVAVLFVQALFVTPQMNVPFSLRQLKGQLKALQKENPAGQLSATSLLWQKFGEARQAAKKLAGTAPTPSPRPRKKPPDNEVRLAFYTNGDPYSYASLQQHAGQITHLCPEWMTVVDGQQIDPAYKKDITKFVDKFADALHDDNKELWLCAQPGQELDYIDLDALADNVDRFVAMLFDETSDTDPPGPLASRSWFEG